MLLQWSYFQLFVHWGNDLKKEKASLVTIVSHFYFPDIAKIRSIFLDASVHMQQVSRNKFAQICIWKRLIYSYVESKKQFDLNTAFDYEFLYGNRKIIHYHVNKSFNSYAGLRGEIKLSWEASIAPFPPPCICHCAKKHYSVLQYGPSNYKLIRFNLLNFVSS